MMLQMKAYETNETDVQTYKQNITNVNVQTEHNPKW